MNTSSDAITITINYDKLILASTALAKELSSKKFPRVNRKAYLSCFLNIGVVDDFLSAIKTAEEAQK